MGIKKYFWKFAYFSYPYLRDFCLFIRITKHKGRQNYKVGFLKKKITKNKFKTLLKTKGYEQSILSWIDDDEVLSMRKRINKFQYHIRLFKDNEIRAHYEYSPESAPIKHYYESMFIPKKQYFKKLLKGLI